MMIEDIYKEGLAEDKVDQEAVKVDLVAVDKVDLVADKEGLVAVKEDMVAKEAKVAQAAKEDVAGPQDKTVQVEKEEKTDLVAPVEKEAQTMTMTTKKRISNWKQS